MARKSQIGESRPSRQVIAVKADKNNRCSVAKRADYPASVPWTFKELCAQAGLPLPAVLQKNSGGRGVPPTQTQGMNEMEMDFPPLADLAQQDFAPDFFGELLPPEMMRNALVAGLAGGGGILVASNAVEFVGGKLRAMDNKVAQAVGGPEGRAVMTVVLGLVGGRLLWDDMDETRKTAAMSFMSAVSGMGVARLVSALGSRMGWTPAHSLSSPEVANVPPDQFFSSTRGPLPLNQVDVTDDDPLALSALGSPEVETDELSLSGWLS